MMRRVVTQHVTLQMEDLGHGPVLLLVHGFPLDHTMWADQIHDLSRECRVIAPDLRGFGGSDPVNPTDELSMMLLAQDLADLLDALHVSDPVTFVGLSMGGYVAWQFWRQFAARMSALILCDTRSSADSEQVAQGRRYFAERVLREGPRPATEEMLQKLFAPVNLQRMPQRVAQTLQVMTSTPVATLAAAQRGMAARPDVNDLLPQISCPALVLCGAEDQVTPPGEMQQMAARLAHATYVEIPAAGHLAPLENPAAVNRAIRTFLGLSPEVETRTGS